MNVDVVGRIRPSYGSGPLHGLHIDSHHRITSRSGGNHFSFQSLYRGDNNTYELYKSSLHSLLELFVSGYNVCTLVAGESGSGKSHLVAGDSASSSGIVPVILDHLFAKIAEEEQSLGSLAYNQDSRVTLQMYEVYNETVRDLLQPGRGRSTDYLELDENPDKGVFVQGGESVSFKNSADATRTFRQAFSRRVNSTTDFGPARNHSTVIIYIDLTLPSRDNPYPNKSRFTIAMLSGVEQLGDGPEYRRLRDGGQLSQPIMAVSKLASQLSREPYSNRIIDYSGSKVTQLLKEELGGNVKTRVVVCLKPEETDALSHMLKLATDLSLVKNYPVLNDCWAQNLITQYRARILDGQRLLGTGVGLITPNGVGNPSDALQKMYTENMQLKDKSERLFNRMEQMQGRYGHLANSKTDISAQLLAAEEEKLKISQALVEVQIENNKIQEEMEASKFELTNKILTLENDLMEVELDRDRQAKSAKNAKVKLAELEQDRKDLADEYVVLKTNYLNLNKEHDRQAKQNEELSIELLNLANAKATLSRQTDNMQMASGYQGDERSEVDRLRHVVSRMSTRPYKVDEVKAGEREVVERNLFGNQRHFEGEMERLKNTYDDQQTKLEAKLGDLRKELQETRNLARERQQKIAELNAKLITTTSTKEQLQTQVNRAQHKMKDLNEEYRSRLIKYVEDISLYVDGGVGIPNPDQTSEQMTAFVKKMLQDIRSAHKIREEQLSQAAKTYKERVNEVLRRHEELLIAYRMLKDQLKNSGLEDVGPDEWLLQMTDSELQSAQQREVARLQEQLRTVKNENESLRNSRYQNSGPSGSTGILKKSGPNVTFDDTQSTDNWPALRKKLREFTLNTQAQLEDERARLLSENHILKEQLNESQQYIDSHLVRYKQEIVRLRRMLGIDEDGRIGSGSPLVKSKGRTKTGP